MKNTGIVRNMDQLGRIVIPMEIRKTFQIGERDPLEIFVDGDQIIFKKYQPDCIFCGNDENVVNYKGKNICKRCLNELRRGK